MNPSCLTGKAGQVRMLNYSNFGHRRVPESRYTSVWYAFIGIGLGVVLLCDVKTFFQKLKSFMGVDAETVCETEVHNEITKTLEEPLEEKNFKEESWF